MVNLFFAVVPLVCVSLVLLLKGGSRLAGNLREPPGVHPRA